MTDNYFQDVLPGGKIQPGDSIAPYRVTYQFKAPPDDWIQFLLQGLLWGYTQYNAWYQGTAEVSIAVAVQTFTRIWESLEIVQDIGTIVLFAGNTLPPNTLLCDGSTVSATTYADLYAVIGDNWGSAGSGLFVLPDLRSRVPVGVGTGSGLSSYALAQTGGQEEHTLTIPEMPVHDHNTIPHSHTDIGHVHGVSSAAPNATTIGPGVPEPTAIPLPTVTAIGNASLTTDGVTVETRGDGLSHNNIQPYVGVNYAIIYR